MEYYRLPDEYNRPPKEHSVPPETAAPAPEYPELTPENVTVPEEFAELRPVSAEESSKETGRSKSVLKKLFRNMAAPVAATLPPWRFSSRPQATIPSEAMCLITRLRPAILRPRAS